MAHHSRKEEKCLFRFEPKNQTQRDMVKAYAHNDVLFAVGAAGTGKTFVAMALAAQDLLESSSRRDRIILIRPAVEAEEKLGFIPGTLEEKLEPFMGPFRHVLGCMAFGFPKQKLQVQSLAHLRGHTFADCIVLVDEAQNISYRGFELILSRLGRNAKIILSGDPDQSDLPSTIPGYISDLDAVVDRLEGLDRIAICEFDSSDTVRSPLVVKMLARLGSR